MDIFNVLSVLARRSIVEMLATKGDLSATDISNKFSISPPAISQHLKVLLDAKLVQVEKRGQQRIYHLNIERIYECERWTQKMTGLWNKRFDALDELLKNKK